MNDELQHPTRAEYMAKQCTHQEYYEAVARTAGLSVKAGGPGTLAEALPRVKAALAAGDEHLNTIPLSWWDEQVAIRSNGLRRALRLHGDYLTACTGCCTLKALMKAAANGDIPVRKGPR